MKFKLYECKKIILHWASKARPGSFITPNGLSINTMNNLCITSINTLSNSIFFENVFYIAFLPSK